LTLRATVCYGTFLVRFDVNLVTGNAVTMKKDAGKLDGGSNTSDLAH